MRWQRKMTSPQTSFRNLKTRLDRAQLHKERTPNSIRRSQVGALQHFAQRLPNNKEAPTMSRLYRETPSG